MTMFTKSELELFESSYKGIPGITVLDQGKPGPTVALFGVTHGNEIAGFDALVHLMEEQKIYEKTIHGRIFLIVHNIEAYKAYRKTILKRDVGDTEFRYLDKNMNRIYEDEIVNNPIFENDSEIKRAKEIMKLIPEFDAILDIHSTSRPSDPMLIAGKEQGDQHIGDQLFFYKHILDIFNKIPGESLLGYAKKYGKRGKDTIAIAVECGSHFQSSSKYCARKTAIRFLQAMESVQLMNIPGPDNFNVTKYQVIKNILPKYSDFEWAQNWDGFQKVKAGTIIATENNSNIIADEDVVLLMPTSNPKAGGDGVYFAKIV